MSSSSHIGTHWHLCCCRICPWLSSLSVHMVGENTVQVIDIYIYVKVNVILNLSHFHRILCWVVHLGCFCILCSVFLVCAIPHLLLDKFCFLQVSSASSSTPSLLYLFLSHFCTLHLCFSRHFGVPQAISLQDNLVSSFLLYFCSLLCACHGPPLHSDFKHRIHLNKPHYQTSVVSSCLPFTLLHLTFHFCFILLFHILNLEPKSGSEQTSIGLGLRLLTYIYTVELLVDTQFEYQLGIAKTLSDSKSNLSLSSPQPPLHWTILLYSNLRSLQTPLRNPILGLQLKGDIANSFAKAHTLHGPLLVRLSCLFGISLTLSPHSPTGLRYATLWDGPRLHWKWALRSRLRIHHPLLCIPPVEETLSTLSNSQLGDCR